LRQRDLRLRRLGRRLRALPRGAADGREDPDHAVSTPAGSSSELRGPQETALLLPAPAAERAVAEHRRRLDSAAADGLPAHLTVLDPFVPEEAPSDHGHRRGRALSASSLPNSCGGRRSRRFGEHAVQLGPALPPPVRSPSEQVVAAYPGPAPRAG